MAQPKPFISKGSWVLVTGATGFVGAQTVKQFLERGYKVRGTVRDLRKASWLVDKAFNSYAASGDFELAHVPDLAADHAFDEAVRGVSAIAHVASVLTFDPDPNKVIPQTVRGATNILEAALKEPSVRAFVYTSSVVAATMPMPGNTTHVGQDTWNDAAVQMAWAPQEREPNPLQGLMVYCASKVEAEKAVWKFVKDKNPRFHVNSIAPSVIMGEPLNRTHIENSVAWIKFLYDGNLAPLQALPAMQNIDVKDVALLHVVTIMDPDINNTRLNARADRCNWNDILAIMRRLYPEKKFIDDFGGLAELSITSDFTQPLGLLKKWAGQDGWRTLEQTVADAMGAIVAWDTK